MDSEEEVVVTSCLLAEEEEQKRARKRKIWVHKINKKRIVVPSLLVRIVRVSQIVQFFIFLHNDNQLR
jgi:hypothetical protein